MANRLFDPQSSDNDELYKERATLVAIRFADALMQKRYAEIWHELAANTTRGIFAAMAYLRPNARTALATAFNKPIEEMTQEFFSYVIANNIEGVHTGLWSGIRNAAVKYGWMKPQFNKAQVAFLNEGAVVVCPTDNTPLLVPLLTIPDGSYKVDLETFVIGSQAFKAQDFILEAQRATEIGDFQRAINLLEEAERLKRAFYLLQQYAYQVIFSEERKAEIFKDGAYLAQTTPLLAENRELLSLNVIDALRRDEDETMDFKQHMPPAGNNDERKKLAQDFAAFATSGGGKIYFGITKDKHIVGVEEAKTDNGRDEFRKRIDNMCRDNIKPAIQVRTVFLPHANSTDKVIIPVAIIRPGSEPVYYGDGRPYLRRGQSTSRAEPHEVVELFRQYFIRSGWKAPE